MKSSHHVRFAVSLALWGLLAWGCGRALKPIEPAPPNDFVARLICDQLSDSNTATPLGDVVEIEQNTGFFFQMGLEPHTVHPSAWEASAVVPTLEWALMVVIYPRQSDDTDAQTLKGRVNPLDQLNRLQQSNEKRRWFLPNSGESSFWFYGGRASKTTPRKPVGPTALADWKSGKSEWYWSYMCVNKDQLGEFIYEIRLFPTAHHISPVRRELGPPVLLKRGLLRVVAAPEKASP